MIVNDLAETCAILVHVGKNTHTQVHTCSLLTENDSIIIITSCKQVLRCERVQEAHTSVIKRTALQAKSSLTCACCSYQPSSSIVAIQILLNLRTR